MRTGTGRAWAGLGLGVGLLLGLGGPPAAAQTPGPIEISLVASATTYASTEPVAMQIRVRNTTPDDLFARAGFLAQPFHLLLTLQGPAGPIVTKSQGAASEPGPPQLSAGQEVAPVERLPAATEVVLTVMEDARFYYDLSLAGHYTAEVRVPLELFPAESVFVDPETDVLVAPLFDPGPQQFDPLRSNTIAFTLAVEASPPQTTQSVLEVLEGIVADNPGTPLADKVEDAVAELETVLVELAKTPPDRQAALGNLEGAVGELDAAVGAGLLGAGPGTDLMDQLAGIAQQFAAEALAQAITQGGDPGGIADAQQHLDDGDALRATGAFKDAVAQYKDALAKAEGALP